MRCSLKISLVWALFVSGTFALQGESVFFKAYLGGGYSYVKQNDKAADTGLTITAPLAMSMVQAGGSLGKVTKVFAFTAFHYSPMLSVTARNLKIDTAYSYSFVHDFGLGMGFYSSSGFSLSFGGAVSNNYYNYSVYEVTGVGTHTRHGWAAHLMVGQEFKTWGHSSIGASLLFSYNRVYDVGPSADATVDGIYSGLAISYMYD